MRFERDDYVRDEHVTSLAIGAGHFIESVTPRERVERAAARALYHRTLNSDSVASILGHKLDELPLPGEKEPQQALPLHENIRGGRYYH